MVRNREPYDVQIGHRVRALRIARRLSQAELGKALGVSFQQVQKYEKGVNRVSAGRLQRVAELFEVPVTSFFGRQPRRAEQTDRTFEFLGEAGAIQLLQAYALIRNAGIRQGLVRLARQIAAGQ
jgi:transcriptional regulator with XRE-family HTH domain